MNTYLTLWFNSNGEKPSIVTRKLEQLGFKPVQGNYDFVYKWGQKASIEDVLATSDKVQRELKNCNVSFKLETI